MHPEEIYQIYQLHPSIQTDTRKLRAGDLFFALKGPNFNGNRFAEKALEQGAAYAIVDEPVGNGNDRIIETGDTLETLQALAKMHRERFINIPFIAITGSNGKTTTKELTHEVLSTTFRTYTTRGNLNNHIGVPLTLLGIRDDVEMAVIEMGANHLREIASYCEYAMPTHGLITNIGKAHLEGFGGAENVKIGKGELFEYLGKHAGLAFVNTDDAAVVEVSRGVNRRVFYGTSGDDVRGNVVRSDPFAEISVNGNAEPIRTQLTGAYNFSNILAAVCIGRHFGVPDSKIKTAIEQYEPTNSRSQLMHRGSNTIILDAYNANPGSMKAAIENIAAMKGDQKILLLGAMMELGADSRQEHQAILELIGKHPWQAVVLVGEPFGELHHPYRQFPDAASAAEWVRHQQFEHAQILVKGSRTMQMEKVLE